MKEFTLHNGLRVLFHPMPNTHSVTVALYIKAGIAFGNETRPGITHFLEHLHFRHCGKYSQSELYYKMESIGSSLRATTYHDMLQFYMKVSPEYISECMDIFENIIVADNWTEEEFDKEKKVVKNQIYEEGDYIDIGKESRKLVYYRHPLGQEIMGAVEDVAGISIDEVLQYKKEIFNTSNMLMCITGNTDEEVLRKCLANIEKLYIDNPGKSGMYSAPKRFLKRRPDVKIKKVDDDNLLDVKLSFDSVCNMNKKKELDILNCILGEGVGSRLQMVVREEKGYTSDINSYLEYYTGIAVLYIDFSVAKENLLPCIAEIGCILNSLKCNITKKNLDVSLPFYTTNRFMDDDTEEMNLTLAQNKLMFGGDSEPVSFENNMETIQMLQKTAEELFTKENLCIAVVGKTGKVTHKSIVSALGI